MKRRDFLLTSAAAGVAVLAPRLALAQGAPVATGYSKLLVLVELKGGNDGLNTVVPYGDPAYYALRPRIAIKRGDVLQLDGRSGFHPSLAPLMPVWQARELAIVQGVGYPSPNLSHFRSIEIWDTASRSEETRSPLSILFDDITSPISSSHYHPFWNRTRLSATATRFRNICRR